MCATVCDACADECRLHDMQHCQECAAACLMCAAECREITQANVAIRANSSQELPVPISS
jgi:hypothetical protein